MKNKFPFEEYSVYDIHLAASSDLKKKVKSQMIPLRLAKYSVGIILFLFCSPLIILFSGISRPDTDLLSSVLLTECLLFLSFSLLVGIVLAASKSPKIQELKNLFGYIE